MIGLFACVEPEVETEHFGSPAEAEDLDPADDVVHVQLRAAGVGEEDTHTSTERRSGDHSTPTGSYAYNEQVPGPTIRARLGDLVEIDLENALGVPTSVHWHGIPTSASLDELLLEPGEARSISFVVEQAGSFWYHSGVDPETQLAGGLYGAFIVEDPADPPPGAELVLLWSATDGGDASHDAAEDADAHAGGDTHEDRFARAEEAHDHGAHASTDPADLVWTANGVQYPTWEWPEGESARVRMINASTLGWLELSWAGMRRIGGDQGLLAQVDEAESQLLAPGDRADFEWTSGDFIVSTGLYGPAGAGIGDPVPLMEAVGGGGSPLDWPFPGAAPTADPGGTDAVFVFAGGGDETWLINGAAWPEGEATELPLGEAAVIELRNLSAAEHPVHLHGAPFELLSVDGAAPAGQTWEDTLNLGLLQTARIRIQPEQAGDWPLHCQQSAHEAGGMKTVLHVD